MKSACWFGFTPQLQPLKFALELDLGMRVQTVEDAVEGLDALSKNGHDIVLFNPPVPVGDLILPSGVDIGDWVSSDCYVVKKIREIKPETPIILVHVSSFGRRVDPQEAINRYKRAGITESINWFKFRTADQFTDFLKQYLPKS